MKGGGDHECSPKLENDDFKYVSRLSAILVATIQEAKDRISQIEYIFCSQIYPNFQSKFNSLQKIYLNAKIEMECEWKEKEIHLLEQIEQLRVEKQKTIEENQALKVEKEKSLDKKTNTLLAVITNQKMRIDAELKKHEELEQELMRRSKEVEEGMELHNKLVELVQTKANMIVDKGRQLKKQEEKAYELLAKVKSLERRVEELEEEVRVKTETVAEEKESTDNMRRRITSLSSMIEDNEKLKTEHEEEKKILIFKLDCLEKNVSGLQNQLNEKTEEIERGRVSQKELLEQIDMKTVEILKQKQQLLESENDTNLLLEKVTGLEEKVDELQASLRNSGKDAEGKVLYERLLQQIESKDAKLLAERKKYRDLLDYYKKLKHAHNYVCAKSGLTTENMLPYGKLEDETGSLKHQQNSTNSTDVENKNLDTSAVAVEIKKVKIEHESGNDSEDDEMVKSIPVTSCKSPPPIYVAPKNCPPIAKSAQLTGTKRSASTWIATRSRHGKDGPDPHDDFLDTPLEKLRGNLDKVLKEDVRDLHIPVQKDEGMDPCSSDDETQDVNVDPLPVEKKMPVPMAGKRSFKYIEPVRKKAERDNLKGIECKQCKKFYDAVLPNNGGQNADSNRQNLRCEHHDGVSRHRYKYMPPMTPEGFWNIGFESEM